MLAVPFLVPVRFVPIGIGDRDVQHSTGQRQRLFDAVADSRPFVCGDNDTIDHHLNPLVATRVPSGRLIDRVGNAIDPQSLVTARLQMPPRIGRRFARFDFDGREQQNAAPVGHRHHLVDDLISGLSSDWRLALRAMHHTEPSHQDAHVIINFGHRADGAARRVTDILLFQRHRWRQPFDPFDFRLLGLADKLSCIRRKRFDITSLPFGINRIHRQ